MIPLSYLPPLNAALNALCTVLLLTGFAFIRSGKRRLHSLCMVSALIVSVLFLISYLTYHLQEGTTYYRGVGWLRRLYLSILVSHLTLAMIVPPLAVTTLVKALRQRFDQHRRIARVTLPIWLYVSVTGVVVYLMLRSSYAVR